MPEVEKQTADGHFLDTNVVFDIVYPGRNRHEDAIGFYKKFRNYELAIESAVHAECNKVILQYVGKFITLFESFLASLRRQGRDWNKIFPKNRSSILTEFIQGVSKNKSGVDPDFLPFFKEITEELKPDIVRLNIEDVKQFLLILPSKLTGRLKDQIAARFSVCIPYWDLTDEDVIKFKESAKEVMRLEFSNASLKNDLEIFVNLIILLNYGGTDDEEYKKITLYTKDDSFLEKSKKVSLNPPALKSEEHSEKLRMALSCFIVQSPY